MSLGLDDASHFDDAHIMQNNIIHHSVLSYTSPSFVHIKKHTFGISMGFDTTYVFIIAAEKEHLLSYSQYPIHLRDMTTSGVSRSKRV